MYDIYIYGIYPLNYSSSQRNCTSRIFQVWQLPWKVPRKCRTGATMSYPYALGHLQKNKSVGWWFSTDFFLFTTTCKPLVIWLLPAPVFGLPVRFLASVVIPWKDKTAYSRQVPSYHSRWTQNSTIHIYSPRSLSGFIDSSDWFKVHVTEKPWSCPKNRRFHRFYQSPPPTETPPPPHAWRMSGLDEPNAPSIRILRTHLSCFRCYLMLFVDTFGMVWGVVMCFCWSIIVKRYSTSSYRLLVSYLVVSTLKSIMGIIVQDVLLILHAFSHILSMIRRSKELFGLKNWRRDALFDGAGEKWSSECFSHRNDQKGFPIPSILRFTCEVVPEPPWTGESRIVFGESFP